VAVLACLAAFASNRGALRALQAFGGRLVHTVVDQAPPRTAGDGSGGSTSPAGIMLFRFARTVRAAFSAAVAGGPGHAAGGALDVPALDLVVGNEACDADSM
jgi:hypothetical protein